MTQGTIWNIFGDNPIQDSFFYFLDPCVLVTLRSDGWMDITGIFRIWTQRAID